MVQKFILPKNSKRAELPIVINKKIGSGGFGVVYEILYNNKPAALKIVDKKQMNPKIDYALKEVEKKRIRQQLDFLKGEVGTIQKLQKSGKCNKHLLCYPDISEDKNNVYFVSELMRGDLIQLITSKTFQKQSICRKINIYWNIFGQILNGLETIHKAGILHRDIKPDNILIGLTGSKSPYKKYGAKIADFGLGCIKSVCQGTIGSIPYLQPRVLFQKNFDDWRTGDDMYALGVLLFIMLTGRHLVERPFYDKIKKNNVSYNTAVKEYEKSYKYQMQILDIVKIKARVCTSNTRKRLDKMIKLIKYLTVPEYKRNVTIATAKRILKSI